MLTPRQDSHDRRRLQVAQSFQHHAKANLGVLRYILAEWTRPGQWILDPMAGTGSLYLGLTMGRNVICGELETWQRPILAANLRKASCWGKGAGAAAQWDARALPLAAGAVPAVVFSPPYADTFSDWHISSNNLGARPGPHGTAYGDDRGKAPCERRNIGNLHIYENFLLAMRAVLDECWRVLQPGGLLVMIVKDRIHGGRRLPIVRDLGTLAHARGFTFPQSVELGARLTKYRQIHLARGLPVIRDEWIIVAKKEPRRSVSIPYGVVMVPETGGPPSIVYRKALAHAEHQCVVWWKLVADYHHGLLTPDAFTAPNAVDTLAKRKAADRREWAFGVAAHMVELGVRAGDRVTLHVPERYAPYIEQRLTTFGAVVENPTQGLNLGQKMTWFTERGY